MRHYISICTASLFSFFFLLVAHTQAQFLSMDDTQTPEEMVAYICGQGVVYTNVTYTGANNASGIFENGINCGLSIENGVILTSGKASNAVGGDPNNPGTNNGNGTGTNQNRAGDPDLNAIAGGNTHDACILEFDFIPQSDTIQLNFVFASDEYPEYIYSINDIFAFFISGPNPAGGDYNKLNIALIPETDAEVSIDSVNNGCYPEDGCNPARNPSHPDFFVTNYYTNSGSSFSVEYDGFTVPITAYAHVVPCQTYHIKFTIADEQDHAYDSGVFLEGNSFYSPSVTIEPQYTTPLDSNFAVEGCSVSNVVFSLPQASSDTTWIPLGTIYGTATNGVDYLAVDNPRMILPGDLKDTMVVNPIYDQDFEGIETMIFEYDNNPCTVDPEVFIVKIADFIEANLPTDTTACDGVPITLDCGMDYMDFLWNTGETSRTITVLNPGEYWVLVNNYGCPSSDTVQVSHHPSPGAPPVIYHD